jgi:hypothetical protein
MVSSGGRDERYGTNGTYATYGTYESDEIQLLLLGSNLSAAVAYGSILVPSNSKNFRIHSGCPGQAAAVTSWPSATALV